jgi:4-hydroxy-tetrahydrodipicolinate reductase
MIKICVAGAAGRMGSTLLKEATVQGFNIRGAVEAEGNPNIGKTLKQSGICDSVIEIVSPSRISEALENADVYITFTTAEAEISNLPSVAKFRKPIVLGTTGFTMQQIQKIKKMISDKVPILISPNFSIGINLLFKLTKDLLTLPSDFDFSITEIHHTGKRDAPSGTAKKLGKLISQYRGYSSIVYGREGLNRRGKAELEILSVRGGGIPGIHNLIIAGQHEMLRVEHTAFSRRVFAQGALYATEWICKVNKPGIYSMDDVLGYSI